VAGWFAAQLPAPAAPAATAARVVSVAKPAPQPPNEPRFYALQVPKPQSPPAARATETLTTPAVEPRVQIPDALPNPAHAAAAIASIIPSLPDDLALLNETRGWKIKADDALAHRDRDTAIDLYRSAIPAAKLYLTRPSADSVGKAEIAELYRQLGTLQAIHASSAEARASYREGRRVLLSIRGGHGQWTEDCDRLYEAFERELRGLSRD
jgi:hypothetical protein